MAVCPLPDVEQVHTLQDAIKGSQKKIRDALLALLCPEFPQFQDELEGL